LAGALSHWKYRSATSARALVVVPALDEEDRYPQLRSAREQVVDLARSVLALPLLGLGPVLAATVVGLPVLAGVLAIARSAAPLDRYRADALLGVRLAAPPPVPAPAPHSLIGLSGLFASDLACDLVQCVPDGVSDDRPGRALSRRVGSVQQPLRALR